MRELDVVVVGAGIGGLTAAIALQRDGHRVRVIDQVRELRPVGAGISLWSNGVKVLDALGLGAEVAAVGGHMERMAYADVAGAPLCDFSLAPLVERVGERPYPARRADLQQLLLGAVGDRVTLGSRCSHVDQGDDGVVVHTEGGDALSADLAVVADGTHSRLRAEVVGHPVERTYVGYHNWNGLVPDAASLADTPTTWALHVGDGRRVSTMPVRDGQYVFFDVPIPEATVDPADPQVMLRGLFAGWGPRVQGLIDAIDPDGVAHVAIHTHEPVGTFARGRVALLGDAAHTTAPDLGQGGCLAMEDALVLSHHLTTTSLGVPDALARYSAERVPRARQVMERGPGAGAPLPRPRPRPHRGLVRGARHRGRGGHHRRHQPHHPRRAVPMSGPERRGLTLHVLDTTVGRPGAGVALTVHRITADGAVALATATTDADGRSDGPVVTGEAWSPGVYEVVFALGAYFGDRGDTGFLDEVPVRFTVGPDDVHVHLALLATPWSYHLPGQLTWPTTSSRSTR